MKPCWNHLNTWKFPFTIQLCWILQFMNNNSIKELWHSFLTVQKVTISHSFLLLFQYLKKKKQRKEKHLLRCTDHEIRKTKGIQWIRASFCCDYIMHNSAWHFWIQSLLQGLIGSPELHSQFHHFLISLCLYDNILNNAQP